MPVDKGSTGAENIVHKIYTAPSETLSELKRIVVDMYIRILEYVEKVKEYQEEGILGMAHVSCRFS
jgi:hypothetical protein